VNGGKNALAPNQRLNAPIANEKHMSMATTHPQDVSIKWVKNDMIKAMKQALEALEEIVKWYGVRDKNDVMMPPLNQNPEIKESMDAITSLRQAIEQAERQETNQVTLTQTNIGIGERGMEAYEAAKERGWVGLSDKRLMEMPKQEPVALEAVYETIIHWDEGGGKRSRRELARRIVDLYTNPQPATQDNAFEGLAKAVREFATEQRAIEAKLRSKNR